MISELLKTEIKTLLLLVEKDEINNESAKVANVFDSYFESVAESHDLFNWVSKPYSHGTCSNLGHFSNPKRKLKKLYPNKVSYILRKKLYPKTFLYSRMEPDLVYYLKSSKKILMLTWKISTFIWKNFLKLRNGCWQRVRIKKILYTPGWLLTIRRMKKFSLTGMTSDLIYLANSLKPRVK